MCERVIEGSVDATIEGNVDVSDRKMAELLKEQNALLRHQNTVLSGILDVMKERWYGANS